MLTDQKAYSLTHTNKIKNKLMKHEKDNCCNEELRGKGDLKSSFFHINSDEEQEKQDDIKNRPALQNIFKNKRRDTLNIVQSRQKRAKQLNIIQQISQNQNEENPKDIFNKIESIEYKNEQIKKSDLQLQDEKVRARLEKRRNNNLKNLKNSFYTDINDGKSELSKASFISHNVPKNNNKANIWIFDTRSRTNSQDIQNESDINNKLDNIQVPSLKMPQERRKSNISSSVSDSSSGIQEQLEEEQQSQQSNLITMLMSQNIDKQKIQSTK